LFAVLSLLLGVTLGEIALRIVLPGASVYRALPPNLEVTFNAQHHAVGVKSPALFKVNSMGVRGREWSADRSTEYRILCIGGSTTESVLNDQSRIWTTLLEEKLGTLPDGRRVWVGNIGKAGLATEHHIAQLKHLDIYDPDLVVLLVGSSDFMSSLKRGNDSDVIEPFVDEKAREEQSFAVVPARSLLDPQSPWYKNTRLWHLGLLVADTFSSQSERQDKDGLWLERWRAMRASGKRSNVLPPLETALNSYENNLKEMVSIARHFGAKIFLMTQPSIWGAGLTDTEKGQLWMGGVGEFQAKPGSLYYEPEALERGMDAYNQRLLKVCREADVPCLDLAAAVPKSPNYFYDDEHFTDSGQELVAIRAANAILPLLLQSGVDNP